MDPSSMQILHLIERHGVDFFPHLRERLRRGERHFAIAKEFKIDPGQFSRLLAEVFEPNPWLMRAELTDGLKILAQIDAEKAQTNERERCRVLDAGAPVRKIGAAVR